MWQRDGVAQVGWVAPGCGVAQGCVDIGKWGDTGMWHRVVVFHGEVAQGCATGLWGDKGIW